MKLISWNVNGLRACIKKGFFDFYHAVDADVFCIQETKMQQDQFEGAIDGLQYWNSAEKKGYSGTAVFSKIQPLAVSYGIGMPEHEGEGRVITLEFPAFQLVNVYVPNAKRELERLDYRMRWEDDFRAYVTGLDREKPVIICGDMNVAHQEIDLKNPKNNQKNAGFTPQEREKMSQLLSSGFVDSFRTLYPEKTGAYTWWSYMFHARENNAGWRIDYFLVSEKLRPHIGDSIIYDKVMGSDHCPIELKIDI